MTEADPTVGRVIAGRYRVEARLGGGGMGAVYRARQLDLDRPVALKLIHPHLAEQPEVRDRFEREMRATARVEHPATIRIYDFGTSERGEPFMAMELVHGRDLHDVLADEGRLPWRRACAIAARIARGLAAVHAEGVLHRDLKLANVMLTDRYGEQDTVKVLDFGIAAFSDGGHGITTPGMVVGSATFLAPERCRAKASDHRADLYALGVVLHALISGELPFTAETPLAVMYKQVAEAPTPLATLVPGVPMALEGLVLELLAKDPEARPGSTAAVAAALEACATLPDEGDADASDTDRLPTLAPVAATRVTNVVVPASLFVGRQDELGQLRARLDDGHRLVTIVGAGGTGKTRVATELAAAVTDDFLGGAWFCDLTGATSRDGLCNAVAQALDLTLPAGDPVDALGDALRGRGRTLLILDNLEQVVAPAAAAVRVWLGRASELCLVGTSREALRVDGESLYVLDPLGEQDAAALFVARARAVRPDLVVREADVAGIVTLVRELDGLPLAIELAAARARILTPAQILSHLRERFRLLAGGPRDRSARQATLRGAIDWSWELMSPWERAALAQLSVLRGFDLDAADAVIDLGPWSDAPFLSMDAVQALVDKSMVRVVSADGPRFGLLESIRAYADERLAEPGLGGGAEAAERRHGAWFAARAEGAKDAAALLPDLDNLVIAMHRALGRADAATAVACCVGACRALDLRGPFVAGAELVDRCLAAGPVAEAARLALLVAKGRLLRKACLWDGTRGAMEPALALARRLGDRRQEALALLELANCASTEGHLTESTRLYEQALEAAGAARAPSEEALVRTALGVQLAEHGHLGEAHRHLMRALELATGVDDRQQLATIRLDLGLIACQRGDEDAGEEQYRLSQQLARGCGDRRIEGAARYNLADLLRDAGEHEAALVQYDAARSLLSRVGARRHLAMLLGDRGRLLMAMGRAVEARADHDEALEICEELGDRRSAAQVLMSAAELEREHGDLGAARRRLGRAAWLLEGSDEEHELGLVLVGLGELERAAGELDAAAARLYEAERVTKRLCPSADSPLAQAVTALARALRGPAG